MTLQEYLKTSPKLNTIRTLCILRDNDKVMLAMKKRSFGMGKYNGVGGKVQEGETVLEAARRETFEEIGVNVLELIEIAEIDFYFPYKEEWNQRMIVYLCDKWEGEITESEEMKPFWFNISGLPYKQMWDGDKLWFDKVLQNIKIKGKILFDESNSKVGDSEIIEIP